MEPYPNFGKFKPLTFTIGNNSGLTHIAAAVKTPMIQLFGPGEPEKFGYGNDKNILLMKSDCPYYPCDQRSCKYRNHWCMEQISVEEVMKAFREITDLRKRGQDQRMDM